MSFHLIRRQQFLSEKYYKLANEIHNQIIDDDDGLEESLASSKTEPKEKIFFSHGIANDKFNLLMLDYTAGESEVILREKIGGIIANYERYANLLWKYYDDDNRPAFDLAIIDDYTTLMQIIGLCFLLYRYDLLPRIAALQDGVNKENAGMDTLFEEFMCYGMGPEERYQSDYLCCTKPYRALFHALTELSDEARLKELNTYLKHWYKDLVGCAWHDSHKAEGGYFGYWSFEAGAAVVLLGIKDDSSLHKYLYYPKDLVAWYRANKTKYLTDTKALRDPATNAGIAAGQSCPTQLPPLRSTRCHLSGNRGQRLRHNLLAMEPGSIRADAVVAQSMKQLLKDDARFSNEQPS